MTIIACADCDNVLVVVPKDKDADNVYIPECKTCYPDDIVYFREEIYDA